MSQIHFLKEEPIEGKTVVMRVDFNVSVTPQHSVANDERIRQAIPTIKLLLEKGNKVRLLSHFEPPEGQDNSTRFLAQRLQELLPEEQVFFADNYHDVPEAARLVLMENTRKFEGEKKNTEDTARLFASLGEVFVQDAFGSCHREHASIVGIPKLLPSFAGLLLEKEVEVIGKAIENPARPFVAVLGGAKIDTKLALIERLKSIADYLLLGGKMGLQYQGPEEHVLKPTDYIYDEHGNALDIGPETLMKYEDMIYKAKTVMWNGPVGYVEDPHYTSGTKGIYHAIVSNHDAITIVGGGDTITAIAHEQDLQNITHISTGGGAMLEYVEKGTLPGIEALKRE